MRVRERTYPFPSIPRAVAHHGTDERPRRAVLGRGQVFRRPPETGVADDLWVNVLHRAVKLLVRGKDSVEVNRVHLDQPTPARRLVVGQSVVSLYRLPLSNNLTSCRI